MRTNDRCGSPDRGGGIAGGRGDKCLPGTRFLKRVLAKLAEDGLSEELVEVGQSTSSRRRAFIRELVREFGQPAGGVHGPEPGERGQGVFRVLHGRRNPEVVRRCDLVLVTGSTGGTVGPILRVARRHGVEVVFYGTSAAGVAELLGWERCPLSS